MVSWGRLKEKGGGRERGRIYPWMRTTRWVGGSVDEELAASKLFILTVVFRIVGQS